MSVELQGATMGTRFSVTLIAPPRHLDLDHLRQQILEQLARVEILASTYDPNSEISYVNQITSKDWLSVSDEFCRMIENAQAISEQTGGAFDITVGEAVNAWGFGPDKLRLDLPDTHKVDDMQSGIGAKYVITDCTRPAVRKTNVQTQLDLSGWAKGHAVDTIAAVLAAHQATDYVIEIGGEVRALGRNAKNQCFAIGIESPAVVGRGQGAPSIEHSIPLCDAAIATSGDYRNYYVVDGKRVSHTIDPRTGRPINHDLAAVTVLAPLAARADALATALLVMGPTLGLDYAAQQQIPALFVIRDGERYRYKMSPNFEGFSGLH